MLLAAFVAACAVEDMPVAASESAARTDQPASAGRDAADAIPTPSPQGIRRVGLGSVSGPRAACLDAVRAAERAHGIPDGLMVAIALAESGLHAYAMNIGGRAHFPANTADARRIYNGARAGQSVMAGCVQVNARVHARNSDWPLDPERSAQWGAAYLRTHYDASQDWAAAIRRWNGGGPGDNRLVCRVHAKLAVTNPASAALRGVRCGGASAARERSNGAALLEIAEANER